MLQVLLSNRCCSWLKLGKMMSLQKSTIPSSRAAAPGTSRRAVVSVRAQSSDNKLPIDPAAIIGERLGKWVSTPFDLLAFGPRVGAGALVSMPERLQTLQTDVQRIVELVQDPRPIVDKQEVLVKEVEATLIEFLEKGTTVEQDVLSNVKAVLPAEAANILAELIPEPPNRQPQTGPVVNVPEDSMMSAGEEPPLPPVNYGAQDVLSSQVASEVAEIRNAVVGLKSALDGMRANTDVAAANILKLNLKEARDQLSRRLAEVSPSTAPDPTLGAATREAKILLDEVNAMFF